MIEEETMQKLLAVGLILLMVATWFVYTGVTKVNTKIDSVGDGCGQVVDIIYQQCSEEGNINLTTLHGRSKTLEYTNGVCVIK